MAGLFLRGKGNDGLNSIATRLLYAKMLIMVNNMSDGN